MKDLIKELKLYSHSTANITKYEDKAEQIKKLVCDYFHVDMGVIDLPNRKKEIKDVRHLIRYLVKLHIPRISLKSIARLTADQHHSSVVHSINFVTDQIEVDKRYAEQLEKLNRIIELNLD